MQHTRNVLAGVLAALSVGASQAEESGADQGSPADSVRLGPVAGLVAESADKDTEYAVGYRYHYYDNFFEAPDGVSKTSVSAHEVYTGLIMPVGESGNWSVFGDLNYLDYNRDLDGSWSVTGGVQGKSGPHGTRIVARYRDDVPNAETGNGIRSADVYALHGLYSNRFSKSWQYNILGDFQRQVVKDSPNDKLYLGGAALRYRGWGSIFSPEVGFKYGERHSDSDNNEHDQWDMWLKVRSSPTPKLYLSSRVRYRKRDYDTSTLTDSNFHRDDDRWQFTAGADYKFDDTFSVDAYYAYQDADSSRKTRTFETNVFTVGAKMRF
jgi:hypothetical protein